MPDFEFQPWERFSPDVTDGEAHARAEDHGIQWLFRLCGDNWFARRNDSPGRDENYLCRPLLWVSMSGTRLYLDGNFSTDALIEQVEDEGLFRVGRGMMRVWQWKDVDSGAVMRVAWSRAKEWMLFPNFTRQIVEEDSIPFRFDGGGLVETVPSSVLFERLKEEWQSPKSDMRFTSRYMDLPAEELNLLAVITTHDSTREFVRLLRLALFAFGSKWPADAEAITLNFSAIGGQGKFALQEEVPLGIRERAILNHVVRAFEPRQLPDSPDLPTAIRALTRDRHTRSFSVCVRRPSMHDQFEAALELRAWLTIHWPDGVRHLGKVV